MKIFVFVMILFTPSTGLLPTVEEQMDSLAECQAKVEKVTKQFSETDDTFRFIAGCRIVSKKLDPA